MEEVFQNFSCDFFSLNCLLRSSIHKSQTTYWQRCTHICVVFTKDNSLLDTQGRDIYSLYTKKI